MRPHARLAARTDWGGSRGTPPICSKLLPGVVIAVSDLNGQILDALSQCAHSRLAFPLHSTLRGSFASLSVSERRRAGHCGVVLADLGFSNVARWQSFLLDKEVTAVAAEPTWLPIEDAIVLAHATLMFSWHVVQVQPALAGVLLGMSEPVSTLFRRLGIAELARVAKKHSSWIRPKWAERRDLWQSILETANSEATSDRASVILRCLKASASSSPRLLSALGAAA